MRPADMPAHISPRKADLRDHYDRLAPERDDWIARNGYFHADDETYMRFLVPSGSRVLELGCGTGRLLAALAPSRGVGVDISPAMVEAARTNHPELEFHVGDGEDPAALGDIAGPFDVIVLSDTVGDLDDVQAAISNLHRLCEPDTRVVVAYYSPLWKPILRLAERIGQKMPAPPQNWLGIHDVADMLDLADFEIIKREWRQLVPKRLLGVGWLINRYIGSLPLIRTLCLRHYVVARPKPVAAAAAPSAPSAPSVTVLVPCRNERGNIESAVRRLPRFCDDLEILYVEGHSSDGTLQEIERVIGAYPDRDIKVLVQDGRGKGDAVRKGFDNARGDVLMILDADLTVPPEDLPKFYRALVDGKGEFVNGTRLIYPMEDEAMQFLNWIANQTFSRLFTWLLNQRFTDTLCGTKVLSKAHYRKIAANRHYFGDFDPFGDFDLIFGAAKLNLKVVEVPIRYASRTYGETQISRFTHGWLLLRMVLFAYRKLKAF